MCFHFSNLNHILDNHSYIKAWGRDRRAVLSHKKEHVINRVLSIQFKELILIDEKFYEEEMFEETKWCKSHLFDSTLTFKILKDDGEEKQIQKAETVLLDFPFDNFHQKNNKILHFIVSKFSWNTWTLVFMLIPSFKKMF